MTVNDPGALVARILERPDRRLLPWPEASQDLALLAFLIDDLRRDRDALRRSSEEER